MSRDLPHIDGMAAAQKKLAIGSHLPNNLNTNYSHLHKYMADCTQQSAELTATRADSEETAISRIRSEDLFMQRREIEIDHQGRIYRLRLTQSNKLILTA